MPCCMPAYICWTQTHLACRCQADRHMLRLSRARCRRLAAARWQSCCLHGPGQMLRRAFQMRRTLRQCLQTCCRLSASAAHDQQVPSSETATCQLQLRDGLVRMRHQMVQAWSPPSQYRPSVSMWARHRDSAPAQTLRSRAVKLANADQVSITADVVLPTGRAHQWLAPRSLRTLPR